MNQTDARSENQNKTDYRNQINKVVNAIKEIITSVTKPIENRKQTKYPDGIQPQPRQYKTTTIVSIFSLIMFLCIGVYFVAVKISFSNNGVLEKSIALIPLVNLSGDVSQQYFSDGITEEIINSLTKIEDLKVAGLTSSFFFRGEEDLSEIGKKLKVANVLHGSLRRQGNKVRIDIQLTSVKDGYHLWSEQFDKTINDVFDLQDEIAVAVTQKLKATLLQKEKTEITDVRTRNPAAYDAVLKGRYFWNRRELKESEAYFFAGHIIRLKLR